MATKKTETDNTTRTTASSAVNTPTQSVVNKKENGLTQEPKAEAAKAVHKANPGNPGEPEGVVGGGPNFVLIETKPNPEHLLEQARHAAATLDEQDAGEKERREAYKESNKAAGRSVLKHMLRFVESFRDGSGRVDEDALGRFLDQHVGASHGSAKSPYQRISKYCAVHTTAKSLVSKRAYALDAIVSENIRSSELDARFEQKEKIGPDKIERSGMQKYVLIYELRHGLGKSAAVKYKKMKVDRLIGETLNLLSELLGRQMLSDDFVAEAKKRLDAELQRAA